MSALVLLSGGIDSIVLASLAKKDKVLTGCLFYDWGQAAASEEKLACKLWCGRNGASLLSATLELDARNMNEGKGARVVPARNMAFVAVAIGHAQSLGAREIWYGATLDDAPDYYDCRIEWIHRINEVLLPEGIRVRAPLIDKTKADVVNIGRMLGVPIELTYSCYEPSPFGEPCAECASCVARREALSKYEGCASDRSANRQRA